MSVPLWSVSCGLMHASTSIKGKRSSRTREESSHLTARGSTHLLGPSTPHLWCGGEMQLFQQRTGASPFRGHHSEIGTSWKRRCWPSQESLTLFLIIWWQFQTCSACGCCTCFARRPEPTTCCGWCTLISAMGSQHAMILACGPL